MSSKYGFETNEEENAREDIILQKGRKEALRIDKIIRDTLEDLRIAKKLNATVFGGPGKSQNAMLGEWTIQKIAGVIMTHQELTLRLVIHQPVILLSLSIVFIHLLIQRH